MERLKFLTVSLLLVTILAYSCSGESKKAETKPEAEAKPVADQILITDFEDSSKELITYAGPQSKITAIYSTEQAKSGKQSAKITHDTKDWAGALVVVEKEKGDWTGMKTFRMWVYGSGSKARFNIDLEDAKKEQYRYTITDDFTGWKEFVIPLSDFKFRTDWQAPDAVLNKKLDFPMMTVQFCTANLGNFTLYFDDIIIDSK
ncbi:MAG: carbohydrate binding domain-containing protein [Brevinematia bacterium]